MRHATAEDYAPSDFTRRLTPVGVAEAKYMADLIERAGLKPGVMLVSPLTRADQTADIVHSRFPEVPRFSVEVLATGSADSLMWLCADQADPLLVGHEPLLGAFAARLVGAPNGALPFDRAGLALFEVDRLPPTRPARLLLFCSPRWRMG